MSDETNGRDTHFQGFAKLLWDELMNANGYGYIDVNADFDDGIDPTNYQQIIAQRAYDLLYHAIKHTLPGDRSDSVIKHIVLSHIPDMSEWP